MASALSASAKGASFLILVQIGSRGLTFIINQLLLRYLSPELLGASNQLDLYSISVLYFARESIRVALQRHIGNAQAVVNVSYISILLGFPLAYLLAALYTSSSLPDVPYIHLSIKIYALAAIIELLSEPCFVVVQQELAYKIRAAAETFATIARCITTFAAVWWAHRNVESPGVLPFALGQLAYATVLLGMYYAQTLSIASKETFALSPRKIESNDTTAYILSYFSRPTCVLAANMYLQSALKYILTQGDSLLIASLTTLHDQGAYALASNYGGLIARTIFQPIEESSRNLFAKLCAPSPGHATTTTTTTDTTTDPANPTLTPDPASLDQASTTLLTLLKLYLLLALLATSLGPPLAPPLLHLLAGSRWASTSAGTVLAAYCYYIPLLALNGVSEAFVAAVATPAQLKRQSAAMAAYSVTFAGAGYLFLRVLGLGARGLVWANCVNMLLRVVWNLWFVRGFFRGNGLHSFDLRSTLPTAGSVGVAALAAAVLRADDGLPSGGLDGRLVRNVGVAGIFAVALLALERKFLLHWYRLMMPQRGGGSGTGPDTTEKLR